MPELTWTLPFKNGMADKKLLEAKDVYVTKDGTQVGIDTILNGKVDNITNPVTGKKYALTSTGWVEVTGGASSASDVSYQNETSGLESTDVQFAIDEVAEKLADKVESESVSTSTEGDIWSVAVASLNSKAPKRVNGTPRSAEEDDLYDDPLGLDSVIEGDFIFEVDENTPPTFITWSNTEHTLHVLLSDEPCPNKITIIRKDNGKVCVENAAYARTTNVSNLGENAIYEIQDSILSIGNIESLQTL